jgi:hypothetical protein
MGNFSAFAALARATTLCFGSPVAPNFFQLFSTSFFLLSGSAPRLPRYNPAMPMAPFMERFPELGARETRSVKVPRGAPLPHGDYGFIELYCNEPGCDCRRVTILVLRPHTGWKVWASISYGWESMDFYQKWAHTSDLLDPLEWQGPYLDPMAEQTQYSPPLLDLFESIVLQSPGYEQRLKNHYQMFRATVEQEGADRTRTQCDSVGRIPARQSRSKSRG